jgi:hypothetical protein
MRSSQRGVTFIGWLFLLVPLAVLFYAGIRLTPLYLNYMRVARSLQQTATEYEDGGQINPQRVRNSLEKRFDIESIEFPNVKEIDIHRDGENGSRSRTTEQRAPVRQLSLVVAFKRSAALSRPCHAR